MKPKTWNLRAQLETLNLNLKNLSSETCDLNFKDDFKS